MAHEEEDVPYWEGPTSRFILLEYVLQKFTMRIYKGNTQGYTLMDMHYEIVKLLQHQPRYMITDQQESLPSVQHLRSILTDNVDMFFTLREDLHDAHEECWYIQQPAVTDRVQQLHSNNWERDEEFYTTTKGIECLTNLVLYMFKLGVTPLSLFEVQELLHERAWSCPLARDREDLPVLATYLQILDAFHSLPNEMFTPGPVIFNNFMNRTYETWTYNDLYTSPESPETDISDISDITSTTT